MVPWVKATADASIAGITRDGNASCARSSLVTRSATWEKSSSTAERKAGCRAGRNRRAGQVFPRTRPWTHPTYPGPPADATHDEAGNASQPVQDAGSGSNWADNTRPAPYKQEHGTPASSDESAHPAPANLLVRGEQAASPSTTLEPHHA